LNFFADEAILKVFESSYFKLSFIDLISKITFIALNYYHPFRLIIYLIIFILI